MPSYGVSEDGGVWTPRRIYSGDSAGGASLADVDECLSKCQGEGMTCKDTVGDYECTCAYGTYDKAQDVCVVSSRTSGGGVGAVTLTFIVILTVGVMAGAGYALYKYRLRVSFLSPSLFHSAPAPWRRTLESSPRIVA